jgi:hypothetical protein
MSGSRPFRANGQRKEIILSHPHCVKNNTKAIVNPFWWKKIIDGKAKVKKSKVKKIVAVF